MGSGAVAFLSRQLPAWGGCTGIAGAADSRARYRAVALPALPSIAPEDGVGLLPGVLVALGAMGAVEPAPVVVWLLINRAIVGASSVSLRCRPFCCWKRASAARVSGSITPSIGPL